MCKDVALWHAAAILLAQPGPCYCLLGGCKALQYHDFWWNGVLASAKGIIVETQVQYIRPKERVETVQVPGRSGTLTLLEGDHTAYDNVLYSPVCWLKPGVRPEEIAAWLSGSGRVVFGSMEDRAYAARLINQIPFSALFEGLGVYHSFTPIFDCQPIAYQAAPAADITITASGTQITNPGTAPAWPVIKVYGNGDIRLVLGGGAVDIMDVETGIVLDWNMQDATSLNGGQLLNYKVNGDPQFFPVGRSLVSWAGNVTKVVITPNWRYM